MLDSFWALVALFVIPALCALSIHIFKRRYLLSKLLSASLVLIFLTVAGVFLASGAGWGWVNLSDSAALRLRLIAAASGSLAVIGFCWILSSRLLLTLAVFALISSFAAFSGYVDDRAVARVVGLLVVNALVCWRWLGLGGSVRSEKQI